MRRRADRGSYDPEVVAGILDDGVVAHVGIQTDDGPLVLPMAYGRIGDVVYLHGAPANGLLGAAAGAEVCVTVTLVDAMVVARSPFHNSMNYRSVVVRGRAWTVDDADEKREALRAVSDHALPTWASGRTPTEAEIRATHVVAVPITEASAKIRTGDPVDEPDDLAGSHWAGVVPLESGWGAPRPAADLAHDVDVPSELVAAVEARSPSASSTPPPVRGA